MQMVMSRARSETGGDDKHAMRQAQLAGWYRTGDSWKQLAPNVLNKVQVRKAHKQPDGRYVVSDVPVFYPNAVKPTRDTKGHRNGTMSWSAEDIAEVCRNTNASIESGSQAPPLRLGHFTAEQRAMGIQPPAYGRSVNFRQWKDGMMLCDLVDIDAEFAHDWMQGKQNGLSAGFVADDMGLNRRVGHVARLGAEPQALAYLPCTEIFHGDTLAFAADPAAFPVSSYSCKGHPMKMKKSECHAQMSAAYAAKEANEPKWESKLKEAEDNYAAAMEEDVADPTAAQGPATSLPGSTGSGGSNGNTDSMFSADQFAADPFGAIQKFMIPMSNQVKALTANVDKLASENATLKAISRKTAFAKEIQDLAATHEFSADDFLLQFDAVGGDERALKAIVHSLSKFPARARSLAAIGAIVDRTTASEPHIDPKAPQFAAEAIEGVQTHVTEASDRPKYMNFLGNLPN